MQVASFILIHDHILRQFEDHLEAVLQHLPAPNQAFINLVPLRLHELGDEHPISIPFGTLFPLDQVAGRQRERLLTAFEDPRRPSKLRRMAEAANIPIYYISPARVRDFLGELEAMRLAQQIRSEDVEALLGRQLAHDDLPRAVSLIEQFRRDLYQVYHDAALEGKGVVVMVTSQPDEITSEDEFPRAA